jgi:hypothetical protein
LSKPFQTDKDASGGRVARDSMKDISTTKPLIPAARICDSSVSALTFPALSGWAPSSPAKSGRGLLRRPVKILGRWYKNTKFSLRDWKDALRESLRVLCAFVVKSVFLVGLKPGRWTGVASRVRNESAKAGLPYCAPATRVRVRSVTHSSAEVG